MKLDDILTLAKAGYKPSDVKELMEYVESSPGVKNTTLEEATKLNNQENKPEEKPDALQALKDLLKGDK